MSGIRQSKFKHVYGKALKRDECYECVPITRSTHDTAFCAVNPKHLAIITETGGGGGFVVIPIAKVGRMSNDLPMVAGHTAAVLDIKWCPHNNDVIASASEDCSIKVWQIPEEGIGKEPIRNPIATLIGHQRRVNVIAWHPTAKGIIASSGGDNLTIIWNTETQSQIVSFETPKLVTSLSFNYNGTKLASCCRDGNTRIVDPRTGKILQENTLHQGKKPQMCVFLSQDRLFTTGFSTMSERQLALWDSNNLEECLWRQELDITNGVLFPFYDVDTQIIFICGKGDSTVRYFEYSPDDKQIYYLNRMDSTDPQRGFCFMPKLGLNVYGCEIARMYKLHNNNWCEVIPFIVPRRSGLFQDDLYPDTIAPSSSLTAEQWLAGQDADPIKVSVKESSPVQASVFNVQAPQQVHPQQPSSRYPPESISTSAKSPRGDGSHAACAAHFEDMKRIMEKLSDNVQLLEDRIKSLEMEHKRTQKLQKRGESTVKHSDASARSSSASSTG